MTRHDLPEEDRAQWAEALSDIPGDWVKEMEEKGLPGRDVMVPYIEILEVLGHQFPREWAADCRQAPVDCPPKVGARSEPCPYPHGED